MAHESQLHEVPDDLSDEDAVMVEPAACAVHAACAADIAGGERVMVLGAGTLGLCVVAALRSLLSAGHARRGGQAPRPAPPRPRPRRRPGREAERAQAGRPARSRASLALETGDGSIERLTGGVDVVVDCVGSAESLEQCLDVVRPGGRIVLVGMPGMVRVDLAPLWQREIELRGAYAYGREERPEGPRLDLRPRAWSSCARPRLDRLVSARYPLERYEDAVAHAAAAGRRGAVKIVFDLRKGGDPAKDAARAARRHQQRQHVARTTKEAK